MLNKLLQSDFVKNSSILIIGTTLAQLIPILIQPIIRRVYTDAETGRFDLYMSFVAILAAISHFNYARTVVIPKSEETAKNLLSGAIIITSIVSLIAFLIFLLAGDFIIEQFGLPKGIAPWLKYIPLSVFFIGSYNSINFWLTRNKKFKSIAFNKFIRRSAEGGTQILSKGISKNGLIVGNIVGDLINFAVHLFQLKKTNFNFEGISIKNIKKALIDFKDFPLYSLAPTLLNTISASLPIIIISATFGEKIAGQYGLSRTVLILPLALISVAISQVLLQKISEKKNRQEPIGQIIKGIFLSLSGLSLIAATIIYFFSTPIFNFAFGENWVLASEISKILIFYFCIDFIVTPLSIVFIALEKIKINSLWQIGHFFLILTLYLIQDFTIYQFMYYYMGISIISYLAYGILIYFTVRNYDNRIINHS